MRITDLDGTGYVEGGKYDGEGGAVTQGLVNYYTHMDSNLMWQTLGGTNYITAKDGSNNNNGFLFTFNSSPAAPLTIKYTLYGASETTPGSTPNYQFRYHITGDTSALPYEFTNFPISAGINTQDALNILTPDISIPGYVFDGWYSDADMKYKFIGTTNTTDNVDVYASIHKNPTLHYVLEENPYISVIKPDDVTVPYGTNTAAKASEYFKKPTEIFLDGWYFDGWYTSSDYTGAKYTGITNMTEDVTVYGHYVLPYMSVGPEQTVTVTDHIEEYGSLKIQKSGTDGKVVEGTTFAVTDQDGNRVAVMTTAPSGIAELKRIAPGTYTITETYVPSPYILDSTPKSVTIVKDTEATVSFINPLGKPESGEIEVYKLDTSTELPVLDAEFTVYQWSEASKSYQDTLGAKRLLVYDDSTQTYKVTDLKITDDNKGKFWIYESKVPDLYDSSTPVSEEVELNEENAYFAYIEAYNKPDDEKHGNSGNITVYKKFLAGNINWKKGNPVFNFVIKGNDSDTESTEVRITMTIGQNGTFIYDAVGEDGKKYHGVKNYTTGADGYAVTSITTGEQKDIDKRLWVGHYTVHEEKGSEEFYMIGCKTETPAFTKIVRKLSFLPGNDPKDVAYGNISVQPDTTSDIIFINDCDTDLQTGGLSVYKRILESDIVWANGNPIFVITVNGVDEKGVPHKYQDIVEFKKNKNYTVDEQGYAVLEVRFENVPYGTYNVIEENTLGYYLTGCSTTSPNVKILDVGAPGYGRQPVDTAYANITLGNGKDDGNVTFTNKVGRFDYYGHTSRVKNIIPIKK